MVEIDIGVGEVNGGAAVWVDGHGGWLGCDISMAMWDESEGAWLAHSVATSIEARVEAVSSLQRRVAAAAEVSASASVSLSMNDRLLIDGWMTLTAIQNV